MKRLSGFAVLFLVGCAASSETSEGLAEDTANAGSEALTTGDCATVVVPNVPNVDPQNRKAVLVSANVSNCGSISESVHTVFTDITVLDPIDEPLRLPSVLLPSQTLRPKDTKTFSSFVGPVRYAPPTTERIDVIDDATGVVLATTQVTFTFTKHRGI